MLPAYAREAVTQGVVHLGVGAFHRAHQAVVFDRALASGDLRWGVLGASLRSPAVRDQLMPQDGLYTLVERDGDHERHQVIGALQGVLVAPENPVALIKSLAHPDTHIVTLTVTEKGYWLHPVTGRLMVEAPEIAADIASPGAPRTAIGFIVAGLAARRSAGLPPFTAISCDNLPQNGRRLSQAVIEFASAQDLGLARWIEQYGAFPSTMVDRIVPATRTEDVAALHAICGVEDQAMVKTEPFLQWIIEDRFCGPRPDFPAFGATLVKDVDPWEVAKLRLLNGAHSSLAYLGGLAGLEFVHEATARPEYRRFIECLWDESQTTLPLGSELDIPTYRKALMTRFSNSALQHSLRQIAMDGSQKLPQRLLAPVAARLEQGQSIDALVLAIAAWMRWQDGRDDHDVGFAINDPLASQIASRLAGRADYADKAAALLSIEEVFAPSLTDHPVFREKLMAAYARLSDDGAAAVLATYFADHLKGSHYD